MPQKLVYIFTNTCFTKKSVKSTNSKPMILTFLTAKIVSHDYHRNKQTGSRQKQHTRLSCLLYFSSINKANLCVSYPVPLSSSRDEDLTCYTFINIISGCTLCICTYFQISSTTCIQSKQF